MHIPESLTEQAFRATNGEFGMDPSSGSGGRPRIMVGLCPALWVGNAGGGEESAKAWRVTFELAWPNPLQPDVGLRGRS